MMKNYMKVKINNNFKTIQDTPHAVSECAIRQCWEYNDKGKVIQLASNDCFNDRAKNVLGLDWMREEVYFIQKV
jgi:hypothetical protein